MTLGNGAIGVEGRAMKRKQAQPGTEPTMTLAAALKIARTQIIDTGIAMLDRGGDPMPREWAYAPGNRRAQLAAARARRAAAIVAAYDAAADDIVAGRVA